MSEKQKKAFLKRDGWENWSTQHPDRWCDPVTGSPYSFADAYRIASRRRRQREARALRRAGYARCDEGGYHPEDGAIHRCMTRLEALQTLEAQP